MLNRLCAFCLYRVLGWRLEGEVPRQQKKAIIIFLPHTSNWDFVIGWMFLRAENLQVTIFGKDAFNFFPLSLGYRMFNVVPIKRHQNANFVEQATELYARNQNLWTAMAPEGTRSRTDGLKSGYYHLAKSADVPLVVVGPNFNHRTMCVEPPRVALESLEQDTAQLLAFGRRMHACRPELSF